MAAGPGRSVKLVESGLGLFTREPEVTGFEGPSAVVEFETRVPTPAACVYFGAIPKDRDLIIPLYRSIAYENLPEGETLAAKHRIKMDLSGLERVKHDLGLIPGGGGDIAFRVEVFDPRFNRGRQLDGRFRYRREGPPGTGNYRRCVACSEGPFVDWVTRGSAVISWETDQPVIGSVLIGDREIRDREAGRHHELVLSGLEPATRYSYRIRLAPEEPGGRTYSFRTAPEAGSRRPFRFGYLSDSRQAYGGCEYGLNGVNFKSLAYFTRQLYRLGSDFICFGGDLVNGYTSSRALFESQLGTWKQGVEAVAGHIPIYELMGNHEQLGSYFEIRCDGKPEKGLRAYADREGAESAEACFARAFVNPAGSCYGFAPPPPETRAEGLGGAAAGPSYEENVYSFQYGNAHFVALNTNYWYTGAHRWWGIEGEDGERQAVALALMELGGNREGYLRKHQLDWLSRDLECAQDDPAVDWIFVLLHEPAFPCGGHVDDAMYWGIVGKADQGGLNDPDAPLGDVVDMRDRFWRILAAHDKVLAVLVGDEHNYSRMRVDADLDPGFKTPVWQIVSGGCGAPFYVRDRSVPWDHKVAAFSPSMNCCLFEVKGLEVSLTVYSDTGEVLDRVGNLDAVKGRDR